MANIIRTGGASTELIGNAKPEDVAEGKTFYSNDEDTKLVGTLPMRINGGTGENIALWDGKFYVRKISEGIYKHDDGNINSPEVSVPSNLLGNATPEFVLEGQTFTSKNGVNVQGTLNILSKLGFTNVPSGNWVIKKGTLTAAAANSNPNIIPLEVYAGFSQLAGTEYHEVKYGNTVLNSGREYSGGYARCFCGTDLIKQQVTASGCHTWNVVTWLEKI